MGDLSRRMKGVYNDPTYLLTEAQMDALIGCPVITQASHGFSRGQVLYESADGTFALADASDEATFQNGLCICAEDLSTNTFVAWRLGVSRTLAWLSHGIGTPTFGEVIYLSDTPGELDTSPGSWSVRCGYVRDADSIQWEPGAKA